MYFGYIFRLSTHLYANSFVRLFHERHTTVFTTAVVVIFSTTISCRCCRAATTAAAAVSTISILFGAFAVYCCCLGSRHRLHCCFPICHTIFNWWLFNLSHFNIYYWLRPMNELKYCITELKMLFFSSSFASKSMVCVLLCDTIAGIPKSKRRRTEFLFIQIKQFIYYTTVVYKLPSLFWMDCFFFYVALTDSRSLSVSFWSLSLLGNWFSNCPFI